MDKLKMDIEQEGDSLSTSVTKNEGSILHDQASALEHIVDKELFGLEQSDVAATDDTEETEISTASGASTKSSKRRKKHRRRNKKKNVADSRSISRGSSTEKVTSSNKDSEVVVTTYVCSSCELDKVRQLIDDDERSHVRKPFATIAEEENMDPEEETVEIVYKTNLTETAGTHDDEDDLSKLEDSGIDELSERYGVDLKRDEQVISLLQSNSSIPVDGASAHTHNELIPNHNHEKPGDALPTTEQYLLLANNYISNGCKLVSEREEVSLSAYDEDVTENGGEFQLDSVVSETLCDLKSQASSKSLKSNKSNKSSGSESRKSRIHNKSGASQKSGGSDCNFPEVKHSSSCDASQKPNASSRKYSSRASNKSDTSNKSGRMNKVDVAAAQQPVQVDTSQKSTLSDQLSTGSSRSSKSKRNRKSPKVGKSEENIVDSVEKSGSSKHSSRNSRQSTNKSGKGSKDNSSKIKLTQEPCNPNEQHLASPKSDKSKRSQISNKSSQHLESSKQSKEPQLSDENIVKPVSETMSSSAMEDEDLETEDEVEEIEDVSIREVILQSQPEFKSNLDILPVISPLSRKLENENSLQSPCDILGKSASANKFDPLRESNDEKPCYEIAESEDCGSRILAELSEKPIQLPATGSEIKGQPENSFNHEFHLNIQNIAALVDEPEIHSDYHQGMEFASQNLEMMDNYQDSEPDDPIDYNDVSPKQSQDAVYESILNKDEAPLSLVLSANKATTVNLSASCSNTSLDSIAEALRLPQVPNPSVANADGLQHISPSINLTNFARWVGDICSTKEMQDASCDSKQSLELAPMEPNEIRYSPEICSGNNNNSEDIKSTDILSPKASTSDPEENVEDHLKTGNVEISSEQKLHSEGTRDAVCTDFLGQAEIRPSERTTYGSIYNYGFADHPDVFIVEECGVLPINSGIASCSAEESQSQASTVSKGSRSSKKSNASKSCKSSNNKMSPEASDRSSNSTASKGEESSQVNQPLGSDTSKKSNKSSASEKSGSQSSKHANGSRKSLKRRKSKQLEENATENSASSGKSRSSQKVTIKANRPCKDEAQVHSTNYGRQSDGNKREVSQKSESKNSNAKLQEIISSEHGHQISQHSDKVIHKPTSEGISSAICDDDIETEDEVEDIEDMSIRSDRVRGRHVNLTLPTHNPLNLSSYVANVCQEANLPETPSDSNHSTDHRALMEKLHVVPRDEISGKSDSEKSKSSKSSSKSINKNNKLFEVPVVADDCVTANANKPTEISSNACSDACKSEWKERTDSVFMDTKSIPQNSTYPSAENFADPNLNQRPPVLNTAHLTRIALIKRLDPKLVSFAQEAVHNTIVKAQEYVYTSGESENCTSPHTPLTATGITNQAEQHDAQGIPKQETNFLSGAHEMMDNYQDSEPDNPIDYNEVSQKQSQDVAYECLLNKDEVPLSLVLSANKATTVNLSASCSNTSLDSIAEALQLPQVPNPSVSNADGLQHISPSINLTNFARWVGDICSTKEMQDASCDSKQSLELAPKGSDQMQSIPRTRCVVDNVDSQVTNDFSETLGEIDVEDVELIEDMSEDLSVDNQEEMSNDKELLEEIFGKEESYMHELELGKTSIPEPPQWIIDPKVIEDAVAESDGTDDREPEKTSFIQSIFNCFGKKHRSRKCKDEDNTDATPYQNTSGRSTSRPRLKSFSLPRRKK